MANTISVSFDYWVSKKQKIAKVAYAGMIFNRKIRLDQNNRPYTRMRGSKAFLEHEPLFNTKIWYKKEMQSAFPNKKLKLFETKKSIPRIIFKKVSKPNKFGYFKHRGSVLTVYKDRKGLYYLKRAWSSKDLKYGSTKKYLNLKRYTIKNVKKRN